MSAHRGLVLVWRYTSGAPMDGAPRTNATWLHPGTAIVHPTGRAYRWHYRPRLHRAGIRIAAGTGALGELYGLAVAPEVTIGATSAAAVGALVWAGNRGWRRWEQRKHRRTVVQPLLRNLAGPLGLPLGARADKWLMIPPKPAREGQITRIMLPDHWAAEEFQQQQITRIVRNWMDHPAEVTRVHLASAPRFMEFMPTPQPPASVEWRPSDDPYEWHLGGAPGGGQIYVKVETEVPHVAVVAGTGAGKTTTLTLPLLHNRQHGALVDIIDLKRMSFTERKDEHPYGIAGHPDRPSGVVSGVRIHTSIGSAVSALAEFIASATSVALMQMQGIDTSDIPARVLMTDEFGSFAAGVKQWWKNIAKQKTQSLIPFWLHVALMQGRALDHRCIIGAHQLSLKMFGDGGTDARDLFGGRVLVGDCSAQKWITTYGNGIRKPDWDPDIKGRGTYGPLGRRPSLLQTAFVPQADANAMLRALPEAPEWFDHGESAPWITEDYIREVEASYGAGRWVPGWEHLFDGVATAPPVFSDDDRDDDADVDDDDDIDVRTPRLSTLHATNAEGGPIPANYESLRRAVSRAKAKGTFPVTSDGRLTPEEWVTWWQSRPRAAAPDMQKVQP